MLTLSFRVTTYSNPAMSAGMSSASSGFDDVLRPVQSTPHKRPRQLATASRHHHHHKPSRQQIAHRLAAQRPNYGKVTGWMSIHELVKHVMEGDLIEFDRQSYQHWGVYTKDRPSYPSHTGTPRTTYTQHYIVHLAGGGGRMATTIAEDDEELTEYDPTVRSAHGDLTRGESIMSLYATGLGGSQLSDVRVDRLIDVADGGGTHCRVNNSKDHNFAPFKGEETVVRAVGEIGRQQTHLMFTSCEHFSAWSRYGSKPSYQVKARSQSLYVAVQIFTI